MQSLAQSTQKAIRPILLMGRLADVHPLFCIANRTTPHSLVTIFCSFARFFDFLFTPQPSCPGYGAIHPRCILAVAIRFFFSSLLDLPPSCDWASYLFYSFAFRFVRRLFTIIITGIFLLLLLPHLPTVYSSVKYMSSDSKGSAAT